MSINFDVVIDSPDDSVDMKSGLDSLQGISDATRCIGETLLTGRVPERQTHKAKVRTTLKQSFRGSYGQIFSVDVYDDELQKRFRKIGKGYFAELVSHYLNESIYSEPKPLTVKAQGIVDELGDRSEELIKQLRVSALKNIHEVSNKFGLGIKVRYRQSRDTQTELARFDEETASVLDAEPTDEILVIEASITRLNINTGNGRLQIKDEQETVAFGFGVEYKSVTIGGKRKFSENLNFNNGTPRDHWASLRIQASPIRTKDGKIIKYIVIGYEV